MAIETKDRRARIGFGIANLAVAAFVVVGVFRFLPTRWWVVDTGAVVVGLLLGSSGVALLAKASIAEPLTRAASAAVLAIGLALFAALVTTAGWIGGVYGQVGANGAIIFGLVAALVLPYVVVLPAVELAWIGPRGTPARATPASATASASTSSPGAEPSSGVAPASRDGQAGAAASKPRGKKKKGRR
ncbi:MAG: hypothetical protein KF795_33820 [Labilithrix sp.]|nr:hypothetical protein [Labilithrix sp.]